MNPVRAHPNATTAAVAAGPSALVVWAAGKAGWDVPPELAVVMGAGLTATWLGLSRYGIFGVWRRLLRGGQQQNWQFSSTTIKTLETSSKPKRTPVKPRPKPVPGKPRKR